MDKNFTISDIARASNPGNAKLNPFVWFQYDKIIILSRFLVLTCSIRFVQFSNWFIILVVIALIYNLHYWLHYKEYFESGDSNGGVVVALNPTLVAITTDLTKSFGSSYPVVKIINCQELKDVVIGDKIATVALYDMSKDESLHHWVDFHPIPLRFATKDKKTIERAFQSYDDEQWADLNTRLQEIKKPYQAGLYKVETETSDWKNSNYDL